APAGSAAPVYSVPVSPAGFLGAATASPITARFFVAQLDKPLPEHFVHKLHGIVGSVTSGMRSKAAIHAARRRCPLGVRRKRRFAYRRYRRGFDNPAGW